MGTTAANSNALYVGTGGSDSNPGTSPTAAFRTLPPGAVVDIGSYPTTSSTSSNITLDNVGIDGASFLVRVGHYGQNIVVKNSTIKDVQALAEYHSSHSRSSLGISDSNNTFSGTSSDLFSQ